MNDDRLLAGARTVRHLPTLSRLVWVPEHHNVSVQVHVRMTLAPEDNASMNTSLPPVLVRATTAAEHLV